MKHFSKSILLLPVILLLAACAPQQRHALSMQDRASIKSDRVLLNTTQREIAMKQNNWFSSDVPDPYAPMDSGAIVRRNAGADPNAGLVGALIVSGIHHHQAGKAQTGLAPIRSALGNFDYLHYFRNQLQQKIATMPWLKVKKQDLKYNVRETENKLVASAKENTTLFVGTTYALNSTFKQLEVVAYVKLDEKQPNAKNPKTLYANNFYFVYRLKKPNNNATVNQRVWVKNNASFLKSKLRDAAIQLSSMITMDMKKPGPNPYASYNTIVTLRTIDGGKVKGRLIAKKEGYNEIALMTSGAMNGFMYAVNSNDLLR